MERTKIDIISGFLGAGKTTLIKKLLKDAFKGEQVVLIENEFGEIGIDGGFLKEAGIEIREMNSGCICCSLVGDFGASLKEVISKYHPAAPHINNIFIFLHLFSFFIIYEQLLLPHKALVLEVL